MMRSTLAPSSASILLATTFLIGCDDSSSTGPDPDPDPSPVDSVAVSPASAELMDLGEQQQFTAMAWDANGDVVSDAEFTWGTTEQQVVVISDLGLAVATGPGMASVYAAADGVADSAAVTVAGPGTNFSWAAATSGSWDDPSNWSGGAVPGADDTAVIDVAGTYTVTLASATNVNRIVLGSDSGTQTLATGGNQLLLRDGTLTGGGVLEVDGTTEIDGDFDWIQGTLSGSGILEVNPGATLVLGGGTAPEIQANLKNEGTVIVNATVNVRAPLENEPGALLELRSGTVTVLAGGEVFSIGTILKRGAGSVSALRESDGTVRSLGRTQVDAGTLEIRGGELGGTLEIKVGAKLLQASVSTTKIQRGIFLPPGGGTFEINGTITLGQNPGDPVRLNHVVLDSSPSDGIGGPGDLHIDNSLVWRRGTLGDDGEVVLRAGSTTTLEGTGAKTISRRRVDFLGSVTSGTGLDLTLEEGAQLSIEPLGSWTHDGGGTISQGAGTDASIVTFGRFTKTGASAGLSVATAFTGGGDLDLLEGTLAVTGPFRLTPTGHIRGGGTSTDASLNRRLVVINAPSASIEGVIEPDLDDSAARFAILGSVTLAPSCRILIDVLKDPAVPSELVTFETGGQELGGALEVTLWDLPDPPVEYRVIGTTDGTGMMDSLDVPPAFDTVVQDALGVLIQRN